MKDRASRLVRNFAGIVGVLGVILAIGGLFMALTGVGASADGPHRSDYVHTVTPFTTTIDGRPIACLRDVMTHREGFATSDEKPVATAVTCNWAGAR